MVNSDKPVQIQCQINIHKRTFGTKFKNRAQHCISEIKKFAEKLMKSKNIRIDPKLNKIIWAQGPRNAPFNLRVQIDKKKIISDEKEDWVVFVGHIPQVVVLSPIKNQAIVANWRADGDFNINRRMFFKETIFAENFLTILKNSRVSAFSRKGPLNIKNGQKKLFSILKSDNF